MAPILEIKNLSKKYTLGRSERYLTMRDIIGNPFKSARNYYRKRKTEQTFWALDDLTFDVYPGESIGIIGSNGAGKSTLLKILSRITLPTQGLVISRGRIASLLEVGTGFHPELTGRENIFMNGSILGMRRSEILKRFDEIVAFSGVEKFLDTQLKKYSSGMQLRLAFSVAAHMDPEVLIIDEVLAVGDASFQKKCLGKMRDVADSGKTVLFVSHDLAAIRALTEKTLLLKEGKNIAFGSTETTIANYLSTTPTDGGIINATGIHSSLLTAYLVGSEGAPAAVHDLKSNLKIRMRLKKNDAANLSIELFLKDAQHNKIALASLHHFEDLSLPAPEGFYDCEFMLQKLNLASGRYYVDVAISEPKIGWDIYADNAISFEILLSNPKDLSWDFKQEYRYGVIAWEMTDKPSIVLNERGVEV